MHERQIEERIKALRQTARRDPSNADLQIQLGNLLLQEGRFAAAVSSYNRSLKIRPNDLETLHNLGQALHALGQTSRAVDLFRKALDHHPDNRALINNYGQMLIAIGQYEKAEESLTHALEIHTDFPEAHCNLGNALRALERHEEALEHYQRAYAGLPDQPEVLCNLGEMLTFMGQFEQAERILRRAVELQPDFAAALNNLGVVLKDTGALEEAIDVLQQSVTLQPNLASAQSALGALLLVTGKLEQGWQHWAKRDWNVVVHSARFFHTKLPLWEGTPIPGKRLLVLSEQGIGESILFSGLLPEMMQQGVQVLLECDLRMQPIYQRAMPGLETCPMLTASDARALIDQNRLDLFVLSGDLGHWLRPSLDTFESHPHHFLLADESQRQRLRNRYCREGENLLVGIAWFSKHTRYGQGKSMTLMEMRPLLQLPGVTFVDLQYGDMSAQRAALKAETGVEILYDDSIDQMQDLDGFSAQVAAMDLVVTISNSLTHIAGALGIPTWVMLGPQPYWYWTEGLERCLWYPEVRFIRQSQPYQWGPVIEQVTLELERGLADGTFSNDETSR
ncbi:MAG: tetratricopeptide repeat protein [Magnetococcales bacterium]|nr:tetratricopeptide repeat protein [Magnetococcales bacterium]